MSLGGRRQVCSTSTEVLVHVFGLGVMCLQRKCVYKENAEQKASDAQDYVNIIILLFATRFAFEPALQNYPAPAGLSTLESPFVRAVLGRNTHAY